MSRPLGDDARVRILRMIEVEPHCSQRDMAKALDISLGGVNYCLRALVETGWVKVGNFRRSDNKRAYAYLLTPSGVEAKARLTASFLRRKMAEYEALRAEIENLQAELWDSGREGMNDVCKR